MISFSVFFCHIEPTMTKIVTFGPMDSSKTEMFKNDILFLFILSQPTYQKLCFYQKKTEAFGLLKAPLSSLKSKIFKHNIFPTLLCHACMSLWPQLCLLAYRAPKRGRNANFQKSLKVLHNDCHKNSLCQK